MGRIETLQHQPLSTQVYSTGQVAELFQVNFKTVLNWAKSGKLKSWRLPGPRGDFRFLGEDIILFSRTNGMPISKNESDTVRPIVLVVDDDPLMAKCIERALPRRYEVMHAADGYQAGALMALHLPRAVFLDLEMPGIDGVSVLKFMRASKTFAALPVCIISGLGPERLTEAGAAGANIVLPKPFTNEQIQLAFNALCPDELRPDRRTA